MLKKLRVQRGSARPLGVSQRPEGLNFALFSKEAKGVTLCLFTPGSEAPFGEFPLDPRLNKTGFIWHLLIENPPERLEYGYKIQKGPKALHPNPPGAVLFDPYARSLALSSKWGEKPRWLRGRALTYLPFDWEGDVPPNIAPEKLIIYEMHVRGFTNHPSSGVKEKGTYLGLMEKIPYLKELGINAVELLPVHVFDETENGRLNPLTHERLYNFWGYSPLGYFALNNRYASRSEWGEEILEFKQLVKALHRAGIEIILDVVFNHTAESKSKLLSMRGVDEKSYYQHGSDGHLLDFSGCGNTLNCNHPAVSALIVDSLRYFVSELHVDGFRFDLASIFSRGQMGEILEDPPIIRLIASDPLLEGTKLIAEAWDAAGLYQVGSFPGGKRFSEWNGRFRDTVRRFLKGTDDQAGMFATALCGSQDLFGQGSPLQSLNFITAHDGFTLRDLVSYQSKHNEENGENSRDGMNENDSWNCGVEGPSSDPAIVALRERQMRNHLLALFVSIGIPMLLMGDEYGHTREGNNNAYALDNWKNYFLWDELEKNKGFDRFARLLIQLRKKLPHLERTTFLKPQEVVWHGHLPGQPDWSHESRFVAYQLKHVSGDLYIAFNSHFETASVTLPEGRWRQIVNTALAPPDDIVEEFQAAAQVGEKVSLPMHSAILLIMG